MNEDNNSINSINIDTTKALDTIDHLTELRSTIGDTEVEICFVNIRPGTFMMGSPKEEKGRWEDEVYHSVKLTTAFAMGQTQVTQAQYKAVMGTNPSHFSGKDDSSERPVESVSWYDALRFCNKLSVQLGFEPVYWIGPPSDMSEMIAAAWRGGHKGGGILGTIVTVTDEHVVVWDRGCDGVRLPTEAEWEYTAKADSTYRYAGSDDIDKVAWYDGNSGGETHPVAQLQANAWNCYDMSGNVWEWCWDQYRKNRTDGAPKDDDGKFLTIIDPIW